MSSSWTIKLYVFFFVIGFLIDFTTLPEFLYWQSKNYTIHENRIITVIIHLPSLLKPAISWRINNMTTDQVNRVLWVTATINCLFNVVFSVFSHFVLVLLNLVVCQVLMLTVYVCLEYHMV